MDLEPSVHILSCSGIIAEYATKSLARSSPRPIDLGRNPAIVLAALPGGLGLIMAAPENRMPSVLTAARRHDPTEGSRTHVGSKEVATLVLIHMARSHCSATYTQSSRSGDSV